MDHAEMVEDLDSFLQYPWGRLSFDVMMNSIKGRNISQILTASITVGGLFPALQMVVLEAVPSIQDDDESSEDEDSSPRRTGARSRLQKVQLQLNKARVLDEEEKVDVQSIIRPDIEFNNEDLSWSEDEADERVDHMVILINQGFEFKSKMFGPGLKPEELAVRTSSCRGGVKTKVAVVKKGKGKMKKSSKRRNSSSVATDAAKGATLTEETMRVLVQKLIEDNNKKIEKLLKANNRNIVNGVTQWFLDNAVIDREVNAGPSLSGFSASRTRSRPQHDAPSFNRLTSPPQAPPAAPSHSQHDPQAALDRSTPHPIPDPDNIPTVDEILSLYASQTANDCIPGNRQTVEGVESVVRVDDLSEMGGQDAADGALRSQIPLEDGVNISPPMTQEKDLVSRPSIQPNELEKTPAPVNLHDQDIEVYSCSQTTQPEVVQKSPSGGNPGVNPADKETEESSLPPNSQEISELNSVAENNFVEKQGLADSHPEGGNDSNIAESDDVDVEFVLVGEVRTERSSILGMVDDPVNNVENPEQQADVGQVQRRVSKRVRTVSSRIDSPFTYEK
ncbi:uncharacterized protein LOC112084443 [Eutrema salsugineum]|uniref:uncharacterized protein LOC112084443 n=1 Tax=Eutrema salsugineum TaxID=72664 RepID=UPI000CED3C25|nr:uncharacterized protein LOC112084443 [Eutrema salsugineum]